MPRNDDVAARLFDTISPPDVAGPKGFEEVAPPLQGVAAVVLFGARLGVGLDQRREYECLQLRQRAQPQFVCHTSARTVRVAVAVALALCTLCIMSRQRAQLMCATTIVVRIVSVGGVVA